MKLIPTPGAEIVYKDETYHEGDVIEVKEIDDVLQAVIDSGALITEDEAKRREKQAKEAAEQSTEGAEVLNERKD